MYSPQRLSHLTVMSVGLSLPLEHGKSMRDVCVLGCQAVQSDHGTQCSGEPSEGCPCMDT